LDLGAITPSSSLSLLSLSLLSLPHSYSWMRVFGRVEFKETCSDRLSKLKPRPFTLDIIHDPREIGFFSFNTIDAQCKSGGLPEDLEIWQTLRF
jgi:hypothetical protein